MVPTLEALRRRDTRLVLGLRDIEDSPVNVRREWKGERMRDAIRRYYDAIFVYGPPGSMDALRCMGWDDLDVPVHHVGYVGTPMPAEGPPDLPPEYLLATLGGGGDGFLVLAAIVAAVRARPLPCPLVIVTGPLMADGERRHLDALTTGLDIRVEEFRPDMEAVIVGARAVVAMAGYNTVSELLRAGRPSLLVPRIAPREEQLVRARAVAAAGLADLLHPGDLSPARVREALERLLHRPAPTLSAGHGDGAARAAAVLHQLAVSPAPARPRTSGEPVLTPTPELARVA